ncbi:MAG TPA: hypothetical protein VF988_04145 [Verrucomicrobiae bacterium]
MSDGRADVRSANLKRVIQEQLGWELVPGTAPVDMLIVEKAN